MVLYFINANDISGEPYDWKDLTLYGCVHFVLDWYNMWTGMAGILSKL
jgi:hypothetical protein